MGLLADDITGSKTQSKWQQRCLTCEWLATKPLDDDDLAAMDKWVEEGRPAHTLWRLLKKRGLPSSADAFRRLHLGERHGRPE